MLNYREFYGDGLVVTSYLRIRRKSKESKEIDPSGWGKFAEIVGDDRIGQVFVYVIAGSNGFERVAVLPIGSVRKVAFHYSRFRIFWIFFSNF